jgi:hypothetical protein
MNDKYEKGLSYYQKWMLVIIINLVILLFGYKILFANYSFNFSTFNFSDLLALILALFSIGISVAFYFKATDSSNKFYNNTYKFTKDIAELLVRIESSFGEKLEYLGVGYTNINEKFDQIPVLISQIKEKLKESETKRDIISSDKDNLINELLEKTPIVDSEKEQYIKQINDKEEALKKANDEVVNLINKLNETPKVNWRQVLMITPSMKQLIRFALVYPLGENFILTNSNESINKKFQEIKKQFSENALLEYMKVGIIDNKFNLTENGTNYLKSLALER